MDMRAEITGANGLELPPNKRAIQYCVMIQSEGDVARIPRLLLVNLETE